MQSRVQSLLECGANVLIGYLVSVAANAAILPMFGVHVTASDNFAIGAIFTVISLLRSYVLRRAFNGFHSCIGR